MLLASNSEDVEDPQLCGGDAWRRRLYGQRVHEDARPLARRAEFVPYAHLQLRTKVSGVD